jgi:DNA recombination protein RmuC
MINIVNMILGFAVGAVLVWLWLRGKSGAKIAVLEEKASVAEALKQEVAQKTGELSALMTEIVEVRTASEKDRTAADEKLALLEKAKEELGKEFENVANRIFDDKNTKSKANLDEILKPFKSDLGEFKKKVDTVYIEEGKQRQSLLSEIQHLKDLNNQISKEAVDLTQALKGQSKTRGNWGELIIEKVLESSGLSKGRDYDSQLYLKDKHGGTQGRYPDFVIHLPHERDVVIDSKLALNDYDAYCSADSDEERAALLKKHVAAVRGHMVDLASKKYDELEGIKPLDQVIMCVPNEPAYITAVEEDPTLQEDAIKNGIMIVGPNTLVMTLKIVAIMWRANDQSQNALEIADRGQRLYEKFVGFVDDVTAVEKAIASASKACGEAKGKLSEGSGNLVGQAQKLIDLGVKAKKQLPKEMIDQALTAGE